MKSNATLLLILLTSMVSPAAGQQWLKVEGLEFTQRLAVSIENPADVPNEAALVHLSLAELSKALPNAKAGQIAVAEAQAPPAHREQADKNFIPFQVSADTLIFAIPLAAHEKMTLYIYSSQGPLSLPAFPAKTAYDSRHAYRSFENNLMAFRLETGPGANTTGMAIDSFGKSAKGKGLRLVEVYEQGDYHHPQYWGIDILKIGSSPGIGGVYVIAGGQMGRPDSATTFVECVYSGPVETVVRAVANVTVGSHMVRVERTLTLVADDRSIHDRIELQKAPQGVQLGIGVRNLPHETWSENPSAGYAMVSGDNNQPGCKSLGIAAVFDPSQYVRTIDLADEKNGGHIYVLNPKTETDLLVSQHRLAAIWDGDGQINNPGDFETALKRWAILRDHPLKTTLSATVEARP